MPSYSLNEKVANRVKRSLLAAHHGVHLDLSRQVRLADAIGSSAFGPAAQGIARQEGRCRHHHHHQVGESLHSSSLPSTCHWTLILVLLINESRLADATPTSEQSPPRSIFSPPIERERSTSLSCAGRSHTASMDSSCHVVVEQVVACYSKARNHATKAESSLGVIGK